MGSPFAQLVDGMWLVLQGDLFSEAGFQQYSRRWPRSVIALRGICYAPQTSGPRTAGTVSSSSLLLTPTAQLSINGGSQTMAKRREGGHGPTLADQLERDIPVLPTPRTTDRGSTEHPCPSTLTGSHGRDLAPTVGMMPRLPTPRGSDGVKGSPNQRGSSGDLMLAPAVQALPALLPTPSAGVHNDGESLASWEERRARLLALDYNGNGQGTPLAIAVTSLLPTPAAREAKGPGTGTAGRVRPDGRVRTAGDATLGLAVAGMALLPTPTVSDRQGPRDAAGVAARASTTGGPPRKLSETVTNDLLPTPQAHDAQGPKTPEQAEAQRAKGIGPRGRAHGVANLNETVTNELLPTPSGIGGGGQTSRGGARKGEALLSGTARSVTSGQPPASTGSNTSLPSPSGKPSPDDERLTLFDLPS